VTALTALASLGVLFAAFWLLRVAPAAARVLSTTRNAAATMRDPSLDDRARERAIQRASVRLLSGFGSILGRGVLALVSGLLPVWVADRTGVASAHDVVGFLSRWDVLVITSSLMIGAYVAGARPWRSS